ncbi:hypothetical protein BD410DRAFT_763463 [Rickenella mellea]|uniref:Uncharacterized protein n=1 Tax=Rickenella mellea TaxID=50990 RepID=A0A4Y7QHK7_9AGAM|nr:hypothetical protein BD410DRAFT_763463 [Rickenella mellea]
MVRKNLRRLEPPRLRCLSSKLQHFYTRVKLSPCLSAYLVLTIVYCVFQIISQGLMFRDDHSASVRFSSLIAQAKIPRRFAFLLPNDTVLICDDFRGIGNCRVAGSSFELAISPIANGTVTPPTTTTPPFPPPPPSYPSYPQPTASFYPSDDDDHHGNHYDGYGPPFYNHSRRVFSSKFKSVRAFSQEFVHRRTLQARGIDIQPQLNSSGGVDSLTVTGLDGHPQPVTLPLSCIEAQAWPDIEFRDAQREDLTMMIFRIWVVAMSISAIVYDSIPHLTAALLGNLIGLGWSISQVVLSKTRSQTHTRAITNGACNGIELIPAALMSRAERTTLNAVLSGVIFPVFVFLSFKIFKVFRHQTFRRVGATKEVHNICKIALGFCVTLNLSAFLLVASSILWMHELLTGVIRKYVGSPAVVFVIFFACMSAKLPWVFLGPNVVYRERRKLMLVFIVSGIALSATWATTLANPLYQYTFASWSFFASLNILTFIFLVASTVLAIICRFNFGKGLAHYIQVLDALEDAKFTPAYFSHDPEKAEVYRQDKLAEVASLARRDSAILAGLPILDQAQAYSTTYSYDDLKADLPSPTESHGRFMDLPLHDPVRLPRPNSTLSGSSNDTRTTGVSGVSGVSWSSWLWSRGVAALSRTPSPTSPSSSRGPRRHTPDVPTSRFSSDESILSGSSSTTLSPSNSSEEVGMGKSHFSDWTSEENSSNLVLPDISRPLPTHPR